ncbi:MAG: hypothetical protein KI786_02780, partial [Mameliella sp.]|nr:hypothetical protein [Phaeodactylibacter sp.]
EQYTVIERKQFTDITTKHGINAVPNDNSPLWTMGWDKRSVRLKVLDQGKWHTFLLPKATYNNDPGHGWFTEWPRIREIHDGRFMMDMHGMFYDFPPDFNAKNTGGVRPIGSHLRYIPDFLYWNGKIVLATDEVSIQGNPLAGQPQSNLWMGDFSALSEWGPASAYGAIWIEDDVTPNQPSLPFLFAGFDQRVLHLTNHYDLPVSITIETDQKGNGEWVKQSHIQLPAGGYQFEIFATGLQAEWIRLSADQPAKLTANFHYTQKSKAQPKEHRNLFSALAGNTDLNSASFTKLYPNHDNFNLTVFSGNIEGDKFESVTAMELDKFSLEFIPGLRDSSALRALADTLTWNKHILPQQVFGEDETSVFLETENGRLRLPKGQTDYPSPALRQVRELQSERVLANFHGTFYELPLEIVGEEPIHAKMRPVSTHNRMISDFATWNGLLLLGGIKSDAGTSPNLLKDPVSGAAVWIGGIDDLWKFGKPTGEGGVWKNTPVKAGVRSDLFLMTGYDQKTVSISTDRDATVTLYIHTCHYSDEIVPYQSFEVKAGETLAHQFPLGFSAHWVAAEIDKGCTATVWFTYE